MHNRLTSIGLMVSLFFVCNHNHQPHRAPLWYGWPGEGASAGLPDHIPPVVSSAHEPDYLGNWLYSNAEAPIEAIELIEIGTVCPDNFCSERHRAIIKKRIERILGMAEEPLSYRWRPTALLLKAGLWGAQIVLAE